MKIIVTVFCFLFLLPACCYPVHYDGPYKGKIVDADTGRPIEGVVILGVWYKEIATVAGGVSSYYDAKETLSDKNGDFEIQGLGLKVLSNVKPMNVLIFKSGYAYIGMGPWDSFRLDGGALEKKVDWEGDRAIIPLKKLTMEERKKQGDPPDPPSEASFHKVKSLLREINKDRIDRGFRPRQIWGGEKL